MSNKSCWLQNFQSKNTIYCFLFVQPLQLLPGNILYLAHDSNRVAIRHSFRNSACSTATDHSIWFLFLNHFWLHKKRNRNRVEWSRKSTPKTQGQFQNSLDLYLWYMFCQQYPKEETEFTYRFINCSSNLNSAFQREHYCLAVLMYVRFFYLCIYVFMYIFVYVFICLSLLQVSTL